MLSPTFWLLFRFACSIVIAVLMKCLLMSVICNDQDKKLYHHLRLVWCSASATRQQCCRDDSSDDVMSTQATVRESAGSRHLSLILSNQTIHTSDVIHSRKEWYEYVVLASPFLRLGFVGCLRKQFIFLWEFGLQKEAIQIIAKVNSKKSCRQDFKISTVDSA